MTLVCVSRPKPILGEVYVPHRPWIIYDRFQCRVQTVLEAEVRPEWFIYMGSTFAFFGLAHWNRDTQEWTHLVKTHWRKWEPIELTGDLALRSTSWRR